MNNSSKNEEQGKIDHIDFGQESYSVTEPPKTLANMERKLEDKKSENVFLKFCLLISWLIFFNILAFPLLAVGVAVSILILQLIGIAIHGKYSKQEFFRLLWEDLISIFPKGNNKKEG